MFSMLVTVAILIILKFIRIYRTQSKLRRKLLKPGYHVIISGGSKGIGKALAIKYAKYGADVTIVARNTRDLNEAKLEIESVSKPNAQVISAVSLDLTKLNFPKKPDDSNSEQKAIVSSLLGQSKRCDLLINCCGNSIPSKFEDMHQDDFRYMMDVNYFSAVNLTRLLLPEIKKNSIDSESNSRGQIVFVSSMCGILSFYGFSAYSASKFALVGLAEALNMELLVDNIPVTVAFPSDTLTPGFELENQIKPEITKLISETSQTYSPEDVANSIFDDVRAQKFYTTIGFENKVAIAAVNSFMRDSFLNTVLISIISTPLRFISYYLVNSWYRTVMKHDVRRNK